MQVALDKRSYYMHRLAYLYVHGVKPELADHINGCRSDNRISNIRSVSLSENNRNASKKSYSKSRFKGTSCHIKTKKWQSHIQENGKLVFLGAFATDVEAAYVYDMASMRVHGDYGRRNFLPLTTS